MSYSNPSVATRFKPGQSGNLNGRPKGVPNTKTRLQRLLKLTNNLTNPLTGSKKLEGFTIAEQMDIAQILKAIEGDTKAYNALVDRLEGKPSQNHEIGGKDGEPIVFTWKKDA